MVDWKKIKDLRDQLSFWVICSHEYGSEGWKSRWLWLKSANLVWLWEWSSDTACCIEKVKEHNNDSVWDGMRVLKYLKMMELRGSALTADTTGNEVNYAWYLNCRWDFVFQGLLPSLLFLFHRNHLFLQAELFQGCVFPSPPSPF